ncbi:hypothetical protein PINS_up003833 [Pythium insidiosum]|nr:hypothetical protein PINS_up003833 [Pythium insidiosum]
MRGHPGDEEGRSNAFHASGLELSRRSRSENGDANRTSGMPMTPMWDHSPSSNDSMSEHKRDSPITSGSLISLLNQRLSPEMKESSPRLSSTTAGEPETPPSRAARGQSSTAERMSDSPRPQQSKRSHTPGNNNSNPDAGGTKRSRYLREIDRRTIIRRIDNGEKQAALAKEYGVTRAAICHINKNRAEILTRSVRADVHSSARHPKRGMYTTSKPSSFRMVSADSSAMDDLPIVHVSSRALQLHITTLRRRDTESEWFRSHADRAFRLLLEEALACSIPMQTIEFIAANDTVYRGTIPEQATCAIAMNEAGFPMLEAFRCLHLHCATGLITLDVDEDGASASVRRLCVPSNLRQHNVFLLDAVCCRSAAVLAAIQALVDVGAMDSSIVVVSLLAAQQTVSDVQAQHPAVRFVVGDIESVSTEPESSSRSSVGNFEERYFNAAMIRHAAGSSNVQL